jgi:uncharacterized membrane protein
MYLLVYRLFYMSLHPVRGFESTYLYLAEVMNSPKLSHHTMTLVGV